MKRKTPKVNYRDLMPPDEGGQRPEDVPAPVDEPTPAARVEEITPSAPAEPTPVASGDVPETRPLSPTSSPVTDPRIPAVAATEPLAPSPEPTGDLPPNRRRDRSRPLTPRELAAVLNENAPRPDVLRPSASLTIGGESPAAVEPSPMPSEMAGSIATDTMEFAVATAAAALPFRDRVKARLGSVDLLLFRIGHERFAADLAAVEEAVERGEIHGVPEAPPNLIGVVDLRGRLMHVYSPEAALGVRLDEGASALLVVRSEGRRLAVAVDDVDDVMALELDELRDVPTGTDPDGVLLGVAWRGDMLIALLDVEMLTQSLAVEPVPEPA